jgi:transposase
MLDVEEHFMIKDLYRKGISISEIARRTGRDRKTVRKLAAAPLVPPCVRAQPAARTHKLDSFVPYLQGRIGEGSSMPPNCSPKSASKATLAQTQLKDWLKPQRPARQVAATVRFETDPGEQAQTDCHFGTITHQGKPNGCMPF